MSFLDEIDEEIRAAGLDQAVASGNTLPIFDWLLTAFSFQGISDRVARSYMKKHGTTSWSAIEAGLTGLASCPKLRDFWRYEGCRYDKSSYTCAEPEHIDACPVPRPRLRNGRLNQTDFSFFLFVRDIAGGDLIGWIDSQLEAATGSSVADLEAARQEALFVPNIRRDLYDKILEAAQVAAEQSKAEMEAGAAEQSAVVKELIAHADAALAEARCISPITSGLPRSWEEIAVGHMVLLHESPEDGWWEGIVIRREGELLTLRLRDFPKQGTFTRHINTVALVNPGPA